MFPKSEREIELERMIADNYAKMFLVIADYARSILDDVSKVSESGAEVQQQNTTPSGSMENNSSK